VELFERVRQVNLAFEPNQTEIQDLLLEVVPILLRDPPVQRETLIYFKNFHKDERNFFLKKLTSSISVPRGWTRTSSISCAMVI
jgi:hypothetical protein